MSDNYTKIDTLIDNIANDIDNGESIESAIKRALEVFPELSDKDVLLGAFEKEYLCTVDQYKINSDEDEEWNNKQKSEDDFDPEIFAVEDTVSIDDLFDAGIELGEYNE